MAQQSDFIKRPSILFVCTANVCRSPMAALIFQKVLEEHGIESASWKVSSAGTWGARHQPADPTTVKLMAEKGLDLSTHRSEIVSADLIKQHDLILVMEKHHKEALQYEFPEQAPRIYLLSEMIKLEEEIEDPFGCSRKKYQKIIQQIEEILRHGFLRIIELVVS